MKGYGLLWGAIGTIAGYWMLGHSQAPEAFGISPDSIWQKIGPLVLGAVLAFVNNTDWPDWAKKLIGGFLKDKGADVDRGNKALELYLKAVEFLNEIQKGENPDQQAVEAAKQLVNQLNQKVVG